MIKLYQVELLPKLLEEIQSSYLETSGTLASAVQVSTEFIAAKVSDSCAHHFHPFLLFLFSPSPSQSSSSSSTPSPSYFAPSPSSVKNSLLV